MPSNNNNNNNNNKTAALDKLKKVVHSFLSRPDARAFAEPVDWRALELYDYPEIITKMMDLGTIYRKLERQGYTTGAQVADDVRTVWSNCMTYNAEGSDLWLVAQNLSRRFEKKYEKLKQQFDMGEESEQEEEEEMEEDEGEEEEEDEEEELEEDDEEDDEEDEEGEEEATSRSSGNLRNKSSRGGGGGGEPSLDAKAHFSANILLLNGVELGYLIRTIECECPNAIERGQSLPEKLEIIVDEMEAGLFTRLNDFAATKAAGRRARLNISTEPPAINDISNKRKRKR